MKLVKLFTIITIIALSVSCNQIGSSDWAFKINDKATSIDEFNEMYYTNNKLLLSLTKEEIDQKAADPSGLSLQVQQFLIKTNFMDYIINQKLLYNKAMSDPDIDKKEMNAWIKMKEMETVGQYYLAKKFKNQIKVTEEEIQKFISANRGILKGRNYSEAEKISKQQIFMKKSKIKFQQYLITLLAESKVNREGLKNYMSKNKKTTTPVKIEETKVETKEESKTDKK